MPLACRSLTVGFVYGIIKVDVIEDMTKAIVQRVVADEHHRSSARDEFGPFLLLVRYIHREVHLVELVASLDMMFEKIAGRNPYAG